jgi:hypothetical protein
VLPRVSAALAQFISPIAASGKQSVASQKGFDRFTPPQGKKREQSQQDPSQQNPGSEQNAPQAKIIPFPSKESAAKPNSQAPGTSTIPAGISQALLQLMNLFHEQGAAIRRWIGTGAYQLAARQQKKTGRIRKGTILDERAE